MGRRPSHMLAWLLLSAMLVATGAIGAVAMSDFSGALTSNSQSPGLTPEGQWLTQGFDTIGWDVSRNANGTWHYVYTLCVPVLDMSHFIVQLPTNFTAADILNPIGTFTSFSVGTFTPGAAFPFLPGSIYGADFLTTTGTSTQIAFDANIEPDFGNFYAQGSDDIVNAVFNNGFLIPNTHHDPTCGSIDNKILVPDTTPPISDASTIVLVCFGALQLLAVRKKIFR